MTAVAILAELRAAGIAPALRGDGIAVPAGRLTDAQRDAIRQHKPALLALLKAEAANDPTGEASRLSHRLNDPHARETASPAEADSRPQETRGRDGQGLSASEPLEAPSGLPAADDLGGAAGVAERSEHADDGPKLTGRAADRHAARLHRFIAAGLAPGRAQAAVALLAARDADLDDRRMCAECSHYGTRGRCIAAASGRIPGAASDLQPVPDLLQRCGAFGLRKGLS